MPTESPRVNHNSGPSSFGQSAQSGQRLQGHAPPPHSPYSQHHLGSRVPQHGHPISHVPNRSIPAPPSQYGGMPSARHMAQLPAQPPPPAPPMQPQPNRPMPTPPYFVGGYVNGDYPPQVAPAQAFMGNHYMYPQTYYSMPPASPMQPQPAVNGRAPRQYPPPPVQNPHPQRPPGRVNVPKPHKRVIAIVDPVTKEEIKVEKANAGTPSTSSSPSPSTAVKVHPRASRPLSLVADPADAYPPVSDKVERGTPDDSIPKDSGSKSTPHENARKRLDTESSDSSKVGNFKHMESTKESPVTEQKDVIPDTRVSSKNAERISSVGDISTARLEGRGQMAEHDDRNHVEGQELSKPEFNPIGQPVEETSNLPSKAHDNFDGMTSDVSSSTFADVRQDSIDIPPPNLTSKGSESINAEQSEELTEQESASKEMSPADTVSNSASLALNESDAESDDEKVKDSSPSTSDPKSTAVNINVDVSQTIGESSSPYEAEKLNVGKIGEVDVGDSDDAKLSEDEEDDISPPDDDVEAMLFKPGERRRYFPAVMFALRDSADPKKASEFQTSMASADILKNNDGVKRTNFRDNRSSRLGPGVMSTASHGRAFPPMKIFNVSSLRGPLPTRGSSASADPVDLGEARSQAPPMLPRAPPSARDGDPRGSRTQGPARGGRHSGPVRSAHTPVDPFITQLPVEKLKRSENGWKRNKEEDDEKTAKIKQVRSLLNKLTIEKFDKIFQQIVDIDISSVDILIGIVKEIFEKTLFEPKFSDMYAELCRRLDETIQPMLDKKDESGGKQLNFRKILLNNCKDEFTRFANSSAKQEEKSRDEGSVGSSDEAEKISSESSEKLKPSQEPSKEEEEMRAFKAKRRMLANVRFIGELYLKNLLKETIIHKQCIQKLLVLAASNKEEDVLEAICKLISKTGAKLSANAGAAEHINRYFELLTDIAKDPKVPARIRFMIQDLVEQRNNNWKVRREEASAKTIAEIHKDIELEEKAKVEAQNALRERKHRNQSGRMEHARGGSSFPPRVTMTMANAPKPSTSGMSRTNAALESYRNRSSNSSTVPLQSMRLGPQAKGGLVGAAGAPSLRPRTPGSRFSALGQETQDKASGAIGGNDARRPKVALSRPTGSPRRTPSKSDLLAPKVELMDPIKLKRKSKSILEEYWSIESIKEATECIVEEIEPPNYPAFVDEVIKLSVENKKEFCGKSKKMFIDLVANKVLPAKLFLDSFEKLGPELSNIEMDFPLATDLFAGLVAALASTNEFREVDEPGEYGIGFLKGIFERDDQKNGPCKLIVMVFAALLEDARKSRSEDEAKEYVIDAYTSLGIDLSAEMIAWDSMFGPKMLNTMLNRANVSFLLPMFETELRLREALERDVSCDRVLDLLKPIDTDKNGQDGSEVVKAVIRAALDQAFSDESKVKENVENIFKKTVGPALLKRFGNGNALPASMQFGALCSVQAYFARKESKLPDFIDGEHCASAIFYVLYNSDIVEEQGFRFWKDEEKVSLNIASKDKMLVETSKFFTWLDEAEEE